MDTEVETVQISPEEAAKVTQDIAAQKTAKVAEPPDSPTDVVEPESAPAEADPPKDLKVPDPPKEPKSPADKLAKFSEEFAAEGKLSDKSYGELEKLGYPKDVVDTYIAGQMAIAERAQQEVFNSVGGSDSYRKMTEWAASSLSEDEVKAYNAAVESGDRNQVMFAVKGLQARFQSSREPQTLTGSASKGARGFRSSAEIVEAMRDPRYQKDPAYRADVERRLAASNI